MANPNILVDGVSGLSPPIAALAARSEQLVQFVTVSFQGGRVGLLDRTTPRGQIWFDVLNSLQQTNAPAHVEIDPASNVIAELLCPLTVRVESLTPMPAGDAIEVELVISQQLEKVWIYGQLHVATEASPQVLAASSALGAIDAGSAPTEFMASAVSIVPSSLIPGTGAMDAGSAPSFPSEGMLPDET